MARITIQDACKFDKDKHDKIEEQVNSNADLLNEVIESVVYKHSHELDTVIDAAHAALNKSHDLTDGEIEYFIMQTPIQVYYVSSAQEFIGVKEDVAKIIRQRLYTDARQEATGTVEDKNTAAEITVVQETLTTIAYKRASNILKSKITASYEILSAFKKVMSRRMEDYQLSRYGGNQE